MTCHFRKIVYVIICRYIYVYKDDSLRDMTKAKWTDTEQSHTHKTAAEQKNNKSCPSFLFKYLASTLSFPCWHKPLSLSLFWTDCSKQILTANKFCTYKTNGSILCLTSFCEWGYHGQRYHYNLLSGAVMLHIYVFSRHFIKVQVVQPYNSTDTATAWKNSHFILSERSDFYLVVNLSIAALLHSLELAVRGIGLYVKLDKTEFKSFNKDGAIWLNSRLLNLFDQFIYLGSNILSSVSTVNLCIGKTEWW